jgi:hypothetical protein
MMKLSYIMYISRRIFTEKNMNEIERCVMFMLSTITKN